MALLLIGGSTILTSCVSEDVSPEVENLRQAQVNFLNSQAELEQAQAETERATAAQIAAQTALVQVQIELQQLELQLAQALLQAETDAAIAELEAAVAQAEAAVARAEAQAAQARTDAALAENALQAAIDALAAQVNTTAAGYLSSYQTQMNAASGVLDQINDEQDLLLALNASIDNGVVVDFEAAAALIESQIQEKENEITVKEESIARLTQLNPEFAAVEEEVELLGNQIQALRSEIGSAELDLARYLEESRYDELEEAFGDATNFQNRITSLEEQIIDKQEEVADAQAPVSELTSQLAPYLSILEDKSEAVQPELDTAVQLLDAWIDAYVEFELVKIEFVSGDTEYDDAEAARNDAREDFETQIGRAFNANGNPMFVKDFGLLNFVRTPSPLGDALAEETTVMNNSFFNGLQSELMNAMTILSNREDELLILERRLERNETSLQDTFEAVGVAGLNELETLFTEEETIKTEKEDLIITLNTSRNELTSLRSVLNNYLNGFPDVINDRIANTEAEIEDLREEIIDLNETLILEGVEAERFAAMIPKTEAKIASLTIEYEALIEFANFYLEQFNEVVGD